MKRAALAIAVVSALAGIVAVAADAALSLSFSTLRAPAGEVVTVRTGGSGALLGVAEGPPPQVFLIDADDVNPNSPDIGVTSPGDRRLIALGELTVDQQGNGTLRFAVPEIPSGEYTTVIYCAPCAPFSGGRELLAAGPFPGPFVVLGSGASGDDGPREAVVLGVAGALLLFVVLVGTWTWRLRRRRDSTLIKR